MVDLMVIALVELKAEQLANEVVVLMVLGTVER